MTTDSNEGSDSNSEQQALVKRLAHSATSALDTSLSDTVSSLSDTVARQALIRTHRFAKTSSDSSDAKWLEEIVARVTRQVVVARANLLEVVLRDGVAAGESGTELTDESVDDSDFEVARRRLAAMCEFLKSSLHVNEWYLLKGHYLDDIPWVQLSANLGMCLDDGSPNEDAAKNLLHTAIEQLHEQAAGLLDKLARQRQSAELEEATRDCEQGTDEVDCESMHIWGLTEQQQYLASRFLPWVALRAVNGTPPDLPLEEPLLVNAANSDAFLEWAENAEFRGTPAEPVVVLLEDDDDSLPARFWNCSHGTVSPNDWSRVEDLLACKRLLESESVALSVELEEIPPEADTLTWRVAQFDFDSEEVTSDLQQHLAECVTCRVAFNTLLEKRLAVWRANVADIAPAIDAAMVSETAIASSVAEAAAEESSQASAAGAIWLPEELAGKEWLDAVPAADRPEWSLAMLAAGFVGRERVRALLAELQQSDAARPGGFFYTFARMISELQRRARRPGTPGPALTSYSTKVKEAPPGSDRAVEAGADGGSPRGGPFDTLLQFALGDLGMGAMGSLPGSPGSRDLKATKEQFRNALTKGFPAQMDGWSFTVEFDPKAQELVLHTMKDETGTPIPTFQLDWQRDGETLHHQQSDSGGLRLKLDDLARLSPDERTLLRIQRT